MIEPKEPEEIIKAIDLAILITNGGDYYSIGLRNGMRYAKSLIDGKAPIYENCTDEEPRCHAPIGTICKYCCDDCPEYYRDKKWGPNDM